MFLSEKYKVVPIASDLDLNGSATNPLDSINMTNFHHAAILINFQTLDNAACYVKAYSGASDGACTSALTFYYAFMSAAAGGVDCDVFAATWATSANLSVAHATYDNYMLVLEIPASIMDAANSEKWLTVQLADTDGGLTGNASAVAILSPRYGGNLSASALA